MPIQSYLRCKSSSPHQWSWTTHFTNDGMDLILGPTWSKEGAENRILIVAFKVIQGETELIIHVRIDAKSLEFFSNEGEIRKREI